MSKLRIKKGATVQVIAGADRGKKGEVLEVKAGALKIKVQGVKIMHHFDKKDGMKSMEGFIDYSNVKLLSDVKLPAAKKSKSKTASK